MQMSILLVGLSSSSLAQQSDSNLINGASGPGYKVSVSSVMQGGEIDGTQTYEIMYTYSFDGTNSIYISGLGTSPPTGTLKYINFGPQIEFRDSRGGRIITRVELQPTAVAMGADSTDLPSDKDYPEPFSDGVWNKPELFSAKAIEVIQQLFPLGYAARTKDIKDYLVTTFRGLDVSDPNIRAQIALIISQPYKQTGKAFEYHVQFIARDKPRLSSTYRYGDDQSPQTLTAAAEFLKGVLTELNSQGREHK